MKYFILKALDVSGLKVLEPIVRLVCGEEPLVQVKKIGLFIVVPMITFMLFLSVWAYIGPRHKTKSGEVPGPNVVWEAWNGIVQFARREGTKKKDFLLTGDSRRRALAQVQAELAEVDGYAKSSKKRFDKLDAKRAIVLEEKLKPYSLAMEKKSEEYDASRAAREATLLVAAEGIKPSEVKARQDYLKLVHEHLAISEQEQEHLTAMRAEINEMRAEKWDVLEAERKRKNSLSDLRQFLKKREAQLSTGNRSVQVEQQTMAMTSDRKAFLAASSPTDMLALGTKLVKTDERIRGVAESKSRGADTFFMQIRTSLACVFLGFLIATAIAVPVGVLCGLSDVFMAAISPLISLFKPVSPLVWLPIVGIIVAGFEIPELGQDWAWLVTPSFLSSAVTVALCSLWPTLVNTALGVASIDDDHVNVARVLQLGFWSRLFKIVIPSALPLIFTGLRISLGVGWMVLIAAELLSSSPGIGKFVGDMFNNGSSQSFAQMFVVVFVVGSIGFLLDRIMIVCQRLVSFDGAATAL